MHIVLYFLHLYSEAQLHVCAVFLVCKVEVWLNRLLDTMRSTVRHEMTEAVLAYEERPREQWLFDYPAQVNWQLYCINLMPFVHYTHAIIVGMLWRCFAKTQKLEPYVSVLSIVKVVSGISTTMTVWHWSVCCYSVCLFF